MHVIKLDGYNATVDNGEKLILGTFDSYGVEQLQIVKGLSWENLSVIATFNPPNKKPVQVVVDSVTGIVDVPKEATADLYGVGTIVFVGLADGVQRISVDVEYIVRRHSNASGTEPAVPTPDLLQQVLTLSKDAQAAAKNAEQSAANAVKDATDTVKPFKEEAVQAATAAALSEKSAAESKVAAQNASEVAVQAGIAAGNAADAAEKAAGVATGAAGSSALNAENAQKSEQSAQQSATDAAESQRAAKASADAAAKSQQSAAIDAKTATDAKVAAAGSADNAAGSAATAENAASAAAGSQQAAVASEEKAAVSERAAKESEQAAAKSAEAALESKNAAATSEENAAASAEKAQGVADSLPADYTTAVNEIATLKTDKADKTELNTVKQQVESITPDDSTIGEKPWSSKNIVDMLCPKIEESGNPVQCYPVAGYPLGVKASWEPVQEGEGEPSPTNIRPIVGRNSVTVERCGENLLNLPVKTTTRGIIITTEPDGRYHLKGTLNKDGFGAYIGDTRLPAGTYAIKQASFSTPLNANAIVITVRKYTESGSTVAWIETTSGSGRQNSGSLKQPTNVSLAFYGAAGTLKEGTVIDTYFELMLVAGSTAPTTYTPYIGQTNTLTLPETIYGGSVDARTGEGQETWGAETINQVRSGIDELDFVVRCVSTLSQRAVTAKSNSAISNWLQENVSYARDTESFYTNQKQCYIKIAKTRLSSFDAAGVNEYLSKHPLTVCYKLETPTPFTATGAQPLPALAGVNTVLTDANSVAVTGRADPIKRIEDLEAAVASIN